MALAAALLAAVFALPPPQGSRFGRCAIVFHGKLPRNQKRSVGLDLARYGSMVVPTTRKHVIEPFARAAEVLDVFAHTWLSLGDNSTSVRELTLQLQRLTRYKGAKGYSRVAVEPEVDHDLLRRRMPWWSPWHTPQISGLLSMERGMDLLLQRRSRGVRYRLILLMRLDLVFFRSFAFEELRPGPFYVANRCRAVGSPVVQRPGAICRSLVEQEQDRQGAVADFWFLSTGPVMERVFGKVTQKAGRRTIPGAYVPTFRAPASCGPTGPSQGECCGSGCQKPFWLHWVVLPLLYHLAPQTPLRRHLFHHFDFEFVRDGFLDEDRLFCIRSLNNSGWLRPPPRTSENPVGANMSVCPADAYHCACSAKQMRRWEPYCCNRRQCPRDYRKLDKEVKWCT